jgi:hypothetical protein
LRKSRRFIDASQGLRFGGRRTGPLGIPSARRVPSRAPTSPQA